MQHCASVSAAVPKVRQVSFPRAAAVAATPHLLLPLLPTFMLLQEMLCYNLLKDTVAATAYLPPVIPRFALF